jgi:O-antigen/teichoic acid export membrane protein
LTDNQGYAQRLRAILRSAFSRLFGISPTSGIKHFFRDLGIIVVSFAIARVLSAIASIAAARLLGRDEYGNSQLVITVAQLFSIFALFGLNSAVIRYGAGRKDPQGVTSTAFWYVAAGIVGTIALSLLFAGFVIRAFAITANMYTLGVICGVVYSLMLMANSLQQTIGRFALRGMVEIAFSGIFLVMVITLLLIGPRDYVLASWAYIVAYALTGVIGLVPILAFVRLTDFRRQQLARMMPYSVYNFVSAIGFFLMYSFQRPLLNRLLESSGEVGIFSIYSTASLNLAVFIGSMVTTVFFPRAAARANREHIWRLAVRTWVLAAPLLFVGMSIAQAAVVYLSGKDYPLEIGLIAMFALAACVITIQTNLGVVIGAEGDRGARLGMMMSLTLGATNLLLSWLLIPIFRVYGAPLALTISYAIGIAWLTLVRNKYLLSQSGQEPAGEKHSE